MPIPDYQSLMLPLLKKLEDGEIHSMKNIFIELSDQFQLTEQERNEKVPSGRETKIKNRISWARTYLKKANLLSSPYKGHIKITPLGADLLKNDTPSRIDNTFLGKYEGFANFRPQNMATGKTATSAESKVAAKTPEEEIGEAHRALQEDLALELLETIKETTPQFFESLVINLMLSMGYGGSLKESGKGTPYNNDNGIDGIINEDKLGLDLIYLQAKRWNNTVERPEVDKFIGALTRQGAKKGVFITTSSFSEGAKNAGKGLTISIVLIDGRNLAQLMIDHDVGVSTKNTFKIKQIDSDFFNED